MRTLRFTLFFLLAGFPVASPAEVSGANVPATAVWYFHADFEQMRSGAAGKSLYDWLDEEVFEEVRQVFGTLDILISNAAFGVLKPVLALDLKHWNWTMEKNAGRINEKMLAASANGHSQVVADLVKEEGQIRHKIEKLYSDLERTTNTFEQRTGEFADKLAQLS